MRVAYLTAGAGGMYCGSCLHDNTLAKALLEQGRDILLVPVFTPTRTDERNVSTHRVYYGGINVYLQQRFSFFRRLPAFFDRIFDAPSLLRLAIRTPKGADDEVGRITVSVLQGEEGSQSKELDKLVEGLEAMKPQVVNLPNAMFVGVAREIKRRLGVPVVCNLSGEDLFLGSLAEPYRTQALEWIRKGSQHVDAFVASNEYYGRYSIEHFGAPADRMHVVPLGIEIDDLPDAGERDGNVFTIGYLARLCQDKGLHLICEALGILLEEGRKCRVRAAGYLAGDDRAFVDRLVKRLEDQGHGSAFEVHPDVTREEKLELLRSSDVLSVPSIYQESKGLYLLEAWAMGIPVVEPNHGCFPELVEGTGGGLLFEPNDARDLARSLARLMDDAEGRRGLGDKGRSAVSESMTDRHMADRTWALYEQCIARENAAVRK